MINVDIAQAGRVHYGLDVVSLVLEHHPSALVAGIVPAAMESVNDRWSRVVCATRLNHAGLLSIVMTSRRMKVAWRVRYSRWVRERGQYRHRECCNKCFEHVEKVLTCGMGSHTLCWLTGGTLLLYDMQVGTMVVYRDTGVFSPIRNAIIPDPGGTVIQAQHVAL